MQEEFTNIVMLKALGFSLGKSRFSYTKLKILYQLHLHNKNILRGGWNHNHVSIDTLACHAGVSRDSVKRFIESDDSKWFVDIVHGKRTKRARFTTNSYFIKKEFVDIFSFLESQGFFKGFKSDNHIKWRKGFNNRLERWLLPLLEKGETLQSISDRISLVKEKLSTTKSTTVNVAKSTCTTNPRGLSSFTTPKEPNPVRISPLLEDIAKLENALRDRLFLKDWQIRSLLGNNTIGEVMFTTNQVLGWVDKGTKPRGAGLIWAQIKKNKAERRYL
jgi:hypothetical protein